MMWVAQTTAALLRVALVPWGSQTTLGDGGRGTHGGENFGPPTWVCEASRGAPEHSEQSKADTRRKARLAACGWAAQQELSLTQAMGWMIEGSEGIWEPPRSV